MTQGKASDDQDAKALMTSKLSLQLDDGKYVPAK